MSNKTLRLFQRGNIPEEFWDISLTPTPMQLVTILNLISEKFFNGDSPHPTVQSDFEYVMKAIDTLGDTRWVGTDELIESINLLPDLEDFND